MKVTCGSIHRLTNKLYYIKGEVLFITKHLQYTSIFSFYFFPYVHCVCSVFKHKNNQIYV